MLHRLITIRVAFNILSLRPRLTTKIENLTACCKLEALRDTMKENAERAARARDSAAVILERKLKAEADLADLLKLQELEEAASAAITAAAENVAEDAAIAAKEESSMKFAEAEAARVELEKWQKELEEVVARSSSPRHAQRFEDKVE